MIRNESSTETPKKTAEVARPAEQPGKQAHAAEEKTQAQIVDLEDRGHRPRILLDAAVNPSGTVQGMGADQQYRGERDKVNPDAAPAQKVLLQFNAQHSGEL